MKYLRAYHRSIKTMMIALMLTWQVGQPLQAAIVYWDINGTTAGASSAGSATGTWDGTSTFFNAAADGTGAVAAWAANDTLNIAAGSNATQAYTITVSGTQVIGGLNFEEGLVTLSGGTLELSASSSFDVASGLTATVNSIVDDGAGTFNLTKTGAGRLVLGGTNTYDGRTIINAGTLAISADLNLGDVPGVVTADSITFSGSSALQTTASFALDSNRGITLNGGVTGSMLVDPTFTLTYGGIVTGAAGTTFKKSGAGTLDLQGNSTAAFLGALNVDGGTLRLSGNGEMAGASGVTISNRGTLTLDNSGTNNGNRTAGAITSSGGTINFIANAAATTETLGALTLNAGALTINSTAGAGGSTLTIPSIPTRAAGGTLYVNGTGLGGGTNQVVMTTAPTLANTILKYAVVNNGTVTRFATHGGNGTTLAPQTVGYQALETAWGAATVNALPTADVVLATANRTAYSLTLDDTIDWNVSTADRSLTLSGAVLQTGGTSIVGTAGGTIDNIFAFGANEALFYVLGTLQLNRGNTNTLTGSGGFTKSGSGTLILNGVSTLTGAFHINEGITELRGATALMTTAATININGGTLRLSNDTGTTFTGNVQVNADATIQVDRVTAAATATTHQLGTLSIGGGRTLSINSNDINSGTAYGFTAGALTLTSGGATFDVANNGAGTGTMIVTSVTGAFPLIKTGAGDFLNNSVAAGYSAPVEIQAGRLGWGGSTGTVTESQTFSGAGGLIKSGVVVVNLTGTNTFTGGVTVNAGTLGFSTASDNGGTASNLGQGTDGISLGGGTLSFIGGTSQSTNRAMTLTASSTLNASGTSGATIGYTGAITAGGSSLTLTGTGAGSLTGGFTQTGTAADITVNSGTWTISGGLVTVADDVTAVGSSAVLNLNTTGGMFFIGGGTSLADSTLNVQNGAFVNLGANNVSPTDIANGGVDRLLIGQATAGAVGTLNTNTFNLTSGRLDLGNFSTGLEGAITGTGTITITSDFNFYRGTVSANLAGAAAVEKFGLGTVTFAGDNSGLTSATAVRIDSGNLVLDYTTSNTDKLRALTGLDMRGGTLTLTGNTAATAQTVASLTLANGGANKIDVNAGAGGAVLNLNLITRIPLVNDGTMRFELPTGTQSASNGITTDTLNTSGVGTKATIGGWATVNDGTGVFFARNATNAVDGNIVAATTTLQDTIGSWVAGDNVSDDTLGFSGALDGISLNSLRFNANVASGITINSGGVLGTASGGILMTSAAATGTHSISGGRLVSGIQELIITQDSAVGLEVSSTITGNTGLTKAGNGILTLSGSNNYTGPTDIQAGTVIASGGNAIGNNSVVTLADDQASTLQITGNETIGALAGGNATTGLTVGTVDIGANTLTLNVPTANATYAGVISGSGSIVKTGNFDQILTGASGAGFTGTVNVNTGAFRLSGVGSLNATNITVNKGSLLYLDKTGTTRTGTAVPDNMTITLNSADGAFSGQTIPRGLRIATDQAATTNETVGVITLNSGASYASLDGAATDAITAIIADNITRSNNSTFAVRGTAMSATANARGQLRIGTASNQTAFILAMVGGGGVLGTKTISIVPWAIAQESAAGSGISDLMMGNSLASYGFGQGFRALNLTTEYNTFATKAGNTDNIRESLTANLTGLAGTSLNGLVLNNNNAAAASITVSGTGAGQTLDITSGALLFTLNSAAVAGAYGTTLNGFDTGITVGATNEYVIHVVNPDSAAATKALTATISSPLTSTADITKSGRGTLILSSVNTAGGNTTKTTINEGTLQIGDLDNIGGNTGGLVFAGGTLQLGAAFNVATDDVSGRTITFLQGGGTIDTNGLSPTFAGSLGSGSGTFTKIGAGNLTLNAATAHTGATVITAGTVTLGANQAIGTGALTVSGATTVLAMGAFNATVAGLSMGAGQAGQSITGSGTLTVNGDAIINNTSSIAPILGGTMNLIYTNAAGGTLTLTNAANTFTGYSWIQAGSFSVLNLANAGAASSLGAPLAGDNAAIRLGSTTTAGTLLIAATTGTGGTTDRPFWLTGTTGGGTIDNDGTGALILNGNIKSMEYGAKALLLQGATTGFNNVLNGIIDQPVGTVSLTKDEASTWVLANTASPSTYTGTNTITAGTLQVNRATGGLGNSTAVNAIDLNGGTLSLRNNGAGSNGSITYGSASNPSGYNVQLTTTNSTINVANLTANTGNTIVLGPLTQATAAARTLNITGANGYTLTLASLGLNPGAGQTTTLNPTTASLIITGNVINPMSGFTSGNFDTLTLDGTSTGNSIGGVISDAVGGSIAAGGTTRVTKSNTSTWTLNGASTYTGVTTVNGGTLLVNNTTGSGTGTGLVTVNGGTTTQGVLGGTGIITGGLTLATNGATSFAQGATLNPGTVGGAGTLTINTAGLTTNNFSNLNFDLNTAQTVGGGINDLISTDVIPVIGATTQVNINALGTLTLGLYTLANGYTGTLSNFGNLSLNPVFAGDATRTGILQNNTNQLQLLVTNLTPSTAYWAGAIDGNWNTFGSGAITNWRTDAAANTDTFALPGATTDVFFNTTTPVAANLTTTLAQNFTIKTLNFTADADNAVAINGNTLTITPGSSSTGISIDAGAAGAVTINSNVALGAAQTWTNNSTTSLLTVSGNVTGAFGLTVAGAGNTTISGSVPAGITSLTKNGAGILILSNSNGFTGNTSINGGVVQISADNNLGVAANDVIFGAASATLKVTTDFTPSTTKFFTFSAAGGTIQVDGGATFTQSVANQFISTTAGGGGGLIKTGAGTLNLNLSNSSYDGVNFVGVSGATTVGFRVDEGLLLLTGTSTSVVGDLNPNTLAIQLNGGNLTIRTDTVSIARANVYVTSTPTTITLDRANPGNGIVQVIGTLVGNGLTMGAGSSVLNIAGGSNITGGTQAVSFSGSASLLVSPTFNVTNATGGGAVALTLGALNDNAVARTITKNGNGTLILGTAATSLVSGTVFNVSDGVLIANVTGSLSQVASVANTTTVNISSTGELRGVVAGSFKSTGTGTNSEAINLSAGTLRLSNAATTDFGGNLTYTGGALLLDRTASGAATTATMNSLSIGAFTLTPTTASYTATPTLAFNSTTLTGGATLDSTNALITLGVLGMGGNNLTTQGSNAITAGATTLGGNPTITVGATAPLTLGALNDGTTARTITKNGTGTLTLGSAATGLVDGTSIDINAGTLNSNNATALGALAAVDVADGAIFGVGATQTIGSLNNAGTILNSGIVNMTGAFTLTVGSATNNLTSAYTGSITGATGALTKAGSGSMTLSGLSSTAASNYGGLTTLSAGTLVLNTGNVSLTGGLTLGAAATTTAVALDIDGINATFGGALTMNVNSATASTITVDANKTLTINGNVQIGATTPSGANTVSALTIGGGGSLNVTTAAAGTFSVGGSTAGTGISQSSILDLTGLATATINVSNTGTVRVNQPTGTNVAGNQSSLLLPTPVVALNTSVTTITAQNFNIGDNGGNGNGAGQVNSVTLGTGLTTLNVDTVNIGTGGRDLGQLIYAAGNGTLLLRSSAGGSTRAAFNLATGTANTGVAPGTGVTNNVNLAGHSADLMISTLTIGGQNRNTDRTDTFTFDTGILDATTVVVGTVNGTANGTAASNIWTSTLNLGGGNVDIGTGGLDIATRSTAATGTDVLNGTVNISGGTVDILNNVGFGAAVRLGQNSTAGNVTANGLLNITGGTVTLSGHIIKGATTGAGSATLTLNGASAILDMGGFNIGSVSPTVTFNLQSGTLQNLGEFNGGADLVKTTSGTLTIGGTNTYTGNNVFQEGIVIAAGGANNRLSQTALTLGDSTTSAIFQLGNGAGASNQTFTSLATSGTGTANAIVGGNATFSTLTINQSGNTQFEGNIGGTGTNQNNLNLVKSGVGTLVISGAAAAGAAWTGTTTVNGGDLYIDHKDAFAATSTSLTVADGAEFAVRGSGLTANKVYGFSGGAGNKITLGSGTGTAVLGFRIDGGFNTQLALATGQTMTVTTGSIFQTAVYVDDAPTAAQGYILINGADANSLHAGGGTFDFNPVVFNGGSFTYTLTNDTGGGAYDHWVLTPTAQPALADVWWRGDLTGLAQGVWSATLTSGTGFPSNWDDQQASAGATDAQVPPDSGSIVHFSSDAGANFATTLGANLTIQELIFHSGASAISVDGNSGLYTLTLGNGTDASGITLQSGAQSVSITADVALAQAQSFNVSGTGGGTLTFSRGISGTGPLGINSNGSSTGTMILSGANGLATYSGPTRLVDGRLILEGGASNRLPTTTALTIGDATRDAVLQLGDAANGASNTTIGTLNRNQATLAGVSAAATNGSAGPTTITLTPANAAQVAVGETLGGTGVPGGVTVTAVNYLTGVVTVSAWTAATDVAADQNFTFNASSLTTNSIVGGGATASILTVVQGSAGTFNGIIGGGGTNENQVGITKQGGATLVLSGANTYTGATTVNNGILQLGATGGINGSAGLIVNANAGVTATFDNNGRTTVLTGGITLGGADSSATPVIANSTAGGSITLGGNVVYDATNNPLGGSIAANLNLGAASRTITVDDSATAATDLTISGNILAPASGNGLGITFTGTGVTTVTGNITLTASGDNSGSDIAKTGSGILNLNGTANTNDDFNFTVGTVNLNNTLTVGDDYVSTGVIVTNFTVANALQGTSSTSNGLFARSGATLNINANGALGSLMDFIIAGDTGTGNLVMNADASILRLDVGNDASTEIGLVSGSGVLTVTTTLNLNNGTVSGNLAGAAAAAKVQTFGVTLSGNNALTGTTNVGLGTLTLDYATNAGTNNKIGTGNFSIGNTTHNNLPVVMSIAGHATTASRQDVANFSIAGPSQINLTGTSGVDNILRITGTLSRTAGTVLFSLANANTKLQYSGATTNTNGILPAWMTLNRSDFLTISENGLVDNIVAATYTTQNDTSLWGSNQNITNSAAFTGTLDADCNTINSLRFNAAAASTVTIGTGNTLIVSSGGIMATAAVGNNASVITGGNLVSGVGEFFFHQNNTANTLSIESRLLFSPVITKTGTGTLILSGTNNQTGAITIEEGIIQLSGGSALSDTSAVTIRNSGGTANTGIQLLTNQTETIGTLTANTTAAAIILNTGSTLTIVQGSDQTMAGVISGAGSLVKSGANTLTLTGNNTHTGTIVVNRGLLALSGTAGDLAQSTGYTLNGGELRSVQDQATAVSRLSNTVAITLNNTAGSNGLTVENLNQSSAQEENVGTINLGAGHNVITALPTQVNAAAVALVTADMLSRGSNRATLLVRGLALGSTATVQKGLIRFDSAGQTAVNGFEVGGGTDSGTQFKIIPWLVGDVTNAGLGNSFVTNVDSTTGLRPLASTEYISNSILITGTLTDNIRYTATAAITATPTAINSLVLDSGTAIALTGSASSMEITSGAILAAGDANHSISTITGLTTGSSRDYTIYNTGTGTFTINSALTSAVALVKSGAGLLRLTNTGNLFTDVYLNQGRLQFETLNQVNGTTSALRFFGGGVQLVSTSTIDLSTKPWDINTGGGTIDVSFVTAGQTWANGIDDTTAGSADELNIFTRSSATGTTGLLTIQGASTFTGTVIIRNSGITSGVTNGVVLNGTTNAAINGNLEIGNVTNINDTFDAVVALGASEQIVNTATITFRGASGENAYFKLMGFTETVAGISGTTREGVIENVENTEAGVTTNGKLIVNSSSDFSYNDYLRNRGSGSNAFLLEFEKQGTGTQTLMGDRIVYTGTTTISGGTLQLTDATAFATASNIVNNANLALNRTTSTQTFNNVISGTGTVTKLGSGTVTLGGASSYSGRTNIEQGVLSISASNNLGDASATNDVRIANLATLEVTADVNLGASRALMLSGTGGRVNVTGTNTLTVSGVVEGDECCGLVKEGTGNMVLTNAANTWAGATAVNEGILQVGSAGVGSTGAGQISVASGATLAGSGTVSGSVILGSGAVLQAGDVTLVGTSATTTTTNATLTFTPAFTAASGSEIRLNLTGATALDPFFGGTESSPNAIGSLGYNTFIGGFATSAAGNHDKLVFGDAFNFAAGSEIVVTPVSFTAQKGQIFNLIDWSAAITGFAVGSNYRDGSSDGGVTDDLDLPTLTGDLLWDVSMFQSHGIIVVVPEPSRVVFLMLGLLGLMLRRRRR